MNTLNSVSKNSGAKHSVSNLTLFICSSFFLKWNRALLFTADIAEKAFTNLKQLLSSALAGESIPAPS